MIASNPEQIQNPNRPRRRISIVSLFIYTVLLVALLNLLFYQLASDFTVQTSSDPWNPFDDADKELRQLSTRRENIELHVDDPWSAPQIKTIRFTRIYFAAVYLLYPQRAFLGTDDRIVNFPEEVTAADQLPSETWMRQHQIKSICSVYGLGLSPQLRTTPVSTLSSQKNMGMPTTLFQWEACAAFESAVLRLVQHPGSPTFCSNQRFFYTCLESRSVAGPGRTHPR